MKLQEIVDSFPSHDEFLEKLKQEVIALGQEKPDFVYNNFGKPAGCHYNGPATINFKKGPECSGCIFGQALQKMGWSDEYEMKFDATVNNLFKRYTNVEICDHIALFIKVQARQDGGFSWGEAILVLQ